MLCGGRTGDKKIKITGGEPLVRRGCTALIGRIKQIPGIEEVTLTTNGILLAQQMSELCENGLDAVNISLDTLSRCNYEEITGKDKLESVLEGIQAAVEAGIRVKINSVLQKELNDAEWGQLIGLAKDQPIDVRFIEMMPIGYGKQFETIYNEDIQKKIREIYPDLEEDTRVHGNGPATYYHISGFKGSIGFISAIHGKFCDKCNRIRLTSQGMIKPCLCYGKSYDLKEILRDSGEKIGTEDMKRMLKQRLETAILEKPEQHCFEHLDDITEKERYDTNRWLKMGKIIAICISEKKGTQKHSIESAVLKENWGIEGDAHAGKWHRQVSLLSFEKFDEFQKKGAEIDYGAFGENILVEDLIFEQFRLEQDFRWEKQF